MKNLIKNICIAAAVSPAILGLLIASANAEVDEKRIEIVVDKENDNDAKVEVIVNDNSEKFSLPELANGETRTIVTESGKTIDIHKDNNGKTTLNLDGNAIELMTFNANHGADFSWVSDHDVDFEFNDNKIFMVGGDLSEQAKQALRNTLQSYAPEKELIFADENHSADHNKIMIIKKDFELGEDLSLDDPKAIEHIRVIKKKIKSQQ